MKATTTRREEIFTGVVIALLLFTSTLDGAVAAGLAAAAFLFGLLLFPATRRYAFLAAMVGLAVAAVLVLLRQ